MRIYLTGIRAIIAIGLFLAFALLIIIIVLKILIMLLPLIIIISLLFYLARHIRKVKSRRAKESSKDYGHRDYIDVKFRDKGQEE